MSTALEIYGISPGSYVNPYVPNGKVGLQFYEIYLNGHRFASRNDNLHTSTLQA